MGCNCGNKNKTVVSTIPNMDTCSCGKPISECCKTTGKQCGCHHHEQQPCLADHTQTLVDSVYTTTVTATDTWVMPAVDDCVQLHLKDVTNILPGAILWNKSVGFLHVSSYDATTGYVAACNEGEEGNAEAGSDFPSCMAFHVGIPVECDCSDNWTGPCLAADVTSPGVGETTEVSVTTVSGLFIGDIIDIAGFMYKIVAINDVHTIVVKNEGFGAPLGTVIKNDPNCTGKPCTVKITVVNSDDPCAKDPVHEGVLIVCEDGERKPFEGTADNQITYWDNNDKKWKLKIVKLTEECTNLTVDLTLDPLISVYVVTVAKTSIFKVGDEVLIGDIKFTVDSIINSTRMRLAISEAAPQIMVIEEGSSICLGDCCDGAVSGIDDDGAGTNIMRFVNTASPSITIEKQGSWSASNYEGDNYASLGSNLPTITIANPTSVANGRNLTLVGTITVTIQGQFISDTHTARGVNDDSAAANYPYLTTSYGPEVKLDVMPKLNNVDLYSDPITSYKQYVINTDKLTGSAGGNQVAPMHNRYSRSVTIPIACTVTKGATNTITLDGTVYGYNLRKAGGSTSSLVSFVNNDVNITVGAVQTTVALAWIVQ